MGVVEHVKEITELLRKYDDAELYKKILDLREEIFELRDDNLRLKTELMRRTEAQNIESELIRKGSAYYRRKSDNEEESGPFCMTCWDTERKLVNVAGAGYLNIQMQFRCGNCGSTGDIHRNPSEFL